MLKIGLLSDTHAWWDDKYAEYFAECDEIWHAGDIGSDGLAAKLAALKPFRAVYGNIDGQSLRLEYPEVAHFKAEEVNVMMTHIGGYPGRYNPAIRKRIVRYPPELVHSGSFAHSGKSPSTNPWIVYISIRAQPAKAASIRSVPPFLSIDGKNIKDP